MCCANAKWHDSYESCLAEGHPTFFVQTLNSVLFYNTRQCLYNISSWVGCFCYNQANLIIVLLLLEFGSKHFGWFNYFSKIFHFCFFCIQKQQQTAQEQLFFCIIWHRVFDKTEVCDSDRIIAWEIYSRIFSNSCSWNHRSLSSSIMPFLPIGVMILSGFYFLTDVSKSLARFKNINTNKKHWVWLIILTFHFSYLFASLLESSC